MTPSAIDVYALALEARAAGFAVAERWELERRWFSRLVAPGDSVVPMEMHA